MTLDNIKRDQYAIITGYNDENSPHRAKLVAQGLTKGIKVKCRHAASSGNPLEIEVRGFNLSLNSEEAAIVKILLVAE